MTLIYRSQSYPVGQAREIGRVETYLGTTVTGQPVQYATPLHPFNGMIPNNQLSQLYDQASVTDMKQKVIDEEKYKCDKDKAKQVLGWHPQYADLKVIVEHAWNWHQKRHA